MKKVILYIAVSIDGYIAKLDGGVEWLEKIPNPNQIDFGYSEFYDSIDTTLMGNATYQQLMSWGVDFPYPTKTNYVFSRNPQDPAEYVEFISENISEFIQQLKREEGKDIWLIGGARLNTILLNHNLIDEMIITIIPMILGEGIPLFRGVDKDKLFQLSEIKSFEGGVSQAYYRKEK